MVFLDLRGEASRQATLGSWRVALAYCAFVKACSLLFRVHGFYWQSDISQAAALTVDSAARLVTCWFISCILTPILETHMVLYS